MKIENTKIFHKIAQLVDYELKLFIIDNEVHLYAYIEAYENMDLIELNNQYHPDEMVFDGYWDEHNRYIPLIILKFKFKK